MSDIRMTNGELLDVDINFLTLKLITKLKIAKLEKQLKETIDEDEREMLSMDIAGKMIYVILRSNGKKVDEEEAMMLIPADVEDIQNLFTEFGEKLEEFKKKEELKQKMKS